MSSENKRSEQNIMSDPLKDIQRIIQLTFELEKTYGFGKSYTISTAQSHYSPPEFERKERAHDRWMKTARKWAKIRDPKIAELQTLAEVHRVLWPGLPELVEEAIKLAKEQHNSAWRQVREAALIIAQRSKSHHLESELKRVTTLRDTDAPENDQKETEPNERGYVARPSDPDEYILLTMVLTDYCDDVSVTTVKQIVGIIENFSLNQVRWTRPISKSTGKPNPKRRLIHHSSWMRYVQRVKGASAKADHEGFPPIEADEVESRKRATRRTNVQGK